MKKYNNTCLAQLIFQIKNSNSIYTITVIILQPANITADYHSRFSFPYVFFFTWHSK